MSPRKLGEDTATEEVAEATEETVADTETTDVETETTATEEPAAEEVEPEVDTEPDAGIKEDPTFVLEERDTVRVFGPGTKLKFGNVEVELAEAAMFRYDQARNEQHFAALCRMSGNYDANKHLLSVAYDHNGIPIEPDPE